MILPAIQGLRLSITLTGIAIEYRPKNFVIDRILPGVGSATEQGIYYTWDFGNFNVPETLRNPRAVYKEIDFTATEQTFKAREDGLEGRIDDRERRQAVGILDPDAGLTRRLTNAILLSRERRGINLLTNPANITQNTTLVGAAQWTDPTSDPAADASTAQSTIRAATGWTANVVAMGQSTRNALRLHPAVIDFVEGARPNDQDLADFFEVEEVVVAGAVYNTAREGGTTALSDLWGGDVLFFHRTANPSIDEPNFGYQFVVQDTNVFRYREAKVNCDVIRVTEIKAQKLTAPELGYLIVDAV